MKRTSVMLCAGVAFYMSCSASGQDWPQWRGSHRDGKAIGFEAPTDWPQELTKKWQVKVGAGVATPCLVGDRLYVLARQEDREVVLCLNAATGEEIWRDEYEAAAVSGPASRFTGPRSSPAVAEDKVVTLGVQGTLSCCDAATGKLHWRNKDWEGTVPRFNTASSPLVIDGTCIVQLGEEGKGAIMAFALVNGGEKWKWTGDGPAYSSPMTVTVNGVSAILAVTSQNMVGLNISDGTVLLQFPYTQGRYNAATPIVEGDMIIYAGPNRGITAERITPQGNQLTTKELWTNPDNSVQFNTPVLKNGLLFGLSTTNSLFCINTQDGKTAWTAPLSADTAAEKSPAQAERGRGSRGGRGGGGTGFGSLVDGGSVLLALTPAADLVVLEPHDKEFRKRASYKVASTPTHAYPIAAGNRVYVKDEDSVTLWTIE